MRDGSTGCSLWLAPKAELSWGFYQHIHMARLVVGEKLGSRWLEGHLYGSKPGSFSSAFPFLCSETVAHC